MVNLTGFVSLDNHDLTTKAGNTYTHSMTQQSALIKIPISHYFSCVPNPWILEIPSYLLLKFPLPTPVFSSHLEYITTKNSLACKQALWRALSAEREKEGEVATTSLKFEHLHQKSQCKMSMTLVMRLYSWHVFFTVCLHKLRSFPLRADWRKSNSSVMINREQEENWRWNSILFLSCRQRAPESLLTD